ncbi:hypothetical protein [Mucilaginibacter humi]|nr:hypothetical protein [Mucilaginibacter humi]
MVAAVIIAMLIFGMDQVIGLLLNKFYSSL